MRLTDDRWLGYAEYGDPHGSALFLFHGQPGNRLFRPPHDDLTASYNVRLIVPDRPGYGLSTHYPQRTLLDWPEDLLQLAGFLELDRFCVLGFSGGGPYALACAYAIPGNLQRVVLVSSAPPLYLPQYRKDAPLLLRINYILSRFAPSWMHLFFRLYWRSSRRDPSAFLAAAGRHAAVPDQHILDQRDVHEMLISVWQENLRLDSRGYVQDAIILMGPWGFELDEIDYPITIYQGEVDSNIPPQWGISLAESLPDAHLNLVPEAGHFLLFKYWKEILATLAAS